MISCCLAGMVLRWLQHEYGGPQNVPHVSVVMPSSSALLLGYLSALLAEGKGVHSLLELEIGKAVVSSWMSIVAKVARGINQLTEHAY